MHHMVRREKGESQPVTVGSFRGRGGVLDRIRIAERAIPSSTQRAW